MLSATKDMLKDGDVRIDISLRSISYGKKFPCSALPKCDCDILISSMGSLYAPI